MKMSYYAFFVVEYRNPFISKLNAFHKPTVLREFGIREINKQFIVCQVMRENSYIFLETASYFIAA